MCTSALQGPPLSPKSKAAPTAIAIVVRDVSLRDGQGKIDKVPGWLSVAESNANTRFVGARVPMAALGARWFSFLGAGGGDFLVVGVSGGVKPTEDSGQLKAVLA